MLMYVQVGGLERSLNGVMDHSLKNRIGIASFKKMDSQESMGVYRSMVTVIALLALC